MISGCSSGRLGGEYAPVGFYYISESAFKISYKGKKAIDIPFDISRDVGHFKNSSAYFSSLDLQSKQAISSGKAVVQKHQVQTKQNLQSSQAKLANSSKLYLQSGKAQTKQKSALYSQYSKTRANQRSALYRNKAKQYV
jgi:hypothetical protein